VWLSLAAAIGLVRRWDLTASLRGDELRVTYGLLRRSELVLRSDRIQDARVVERLVLRPFGRADLRLRSAASGNAGSSRVDIPLLSGSEVDHVLGRLLTSAVPRPPLAPAPPAARRRAVVRRTSLAVVLAGTTAVVAATTTWALLAVSAVLVGLGPVLGELAYRGLGWAEAGGVHHARSGALTRRTVIVPAARVQSAAVVASWFQRRRRLASVRLDLAGGSAAVVDREDAESRAIAASATTA
jgi:putative membrane protein